MAFHFEKFSQSSAVFSNEKIFDLAQETYDILEQEETKALIKVNISWLQGHKNKLWNQRILDQSIHDQRNLYHWSNSLLT